MLFIGPKKNGNLSGLIENADEMTFEKIEEFGRKAKERIAQNYSWQDIVDQYEEIFLTQKERIK